jgi:AcrR family transcriptional regulator
MTWTRRPGGYHHGNLKEALVAAALQLIGEKGPQGFTFAEAARQAGVSTAAPYRHFADKDELIAEVARQGFELFAAALEKAWDNGRPSPEVGLRNQGRAYLRFAREQPAYFAAMFEFALPPTAAPGLKQAGDRAFQALRQATDAVCAEYPKDHRPPSLMMALHIWALAHGIAALFARGDAARRVIPIAPEDLLEAAVLVYLDGLGKKSEPRP